MRWPWVHRRKMQHWRREFRLAGKEYAELFANLKKVEDKVRHAAEENQRILGELEANRAALMRSERERLDLQTKLLRVGFGINPFAELVPAAHTPSPEASPVDAPSETMLRPDMSDAEAQQTFVQEAVAKYGQGSIRKIKNHVQLRMDEWYQHRTRPAVLTPEEEAKRLRVIQDMEAAMAEGAAAMKREDGVAS